VLSLLLQLVVPGGVLHSGRLSKIRRGGNCCDHKNIKKSCTAQVQDLFACLKLIYSFLKSRFISRFIISYNKLLKVV
jgi:hypothetical protein